MSYDIFVQGFRDGDHRESDGAAVAAVLAPYVEVVQHGTNLRVGDQTCEIYGLEDLGTGFMVTHVESAVFDVVVAAARAGDMVIMPPDTPFAITDESQRAHLPPEFVEEAVLVTTGQDLIRLIESS